jgi:hypothetical protein
MTDFYADRLARNATMVQQLQYFQGIADEQTAQLLQQEQRKYEEDQRQIVRAEAAVDAAVTSGFASPEDIKEMVNLTGDPALQGSYARQIVARGAIEKRILDNQASQSSLASQALSRRKDLIELALAGDPTAVAQLGFDPAAEIREAAEAEQVEADAQSKIAVSKEIERLDGAMSDIE